MDCIKTICLYLKNYITKEQFSSIFMEHLDDFHNSLDEDLFYNVFSTNFSSKEEKINLDTELRNFILQNHALVYEKMNDSYVELLIDSDSEEEVIAILKKKYEKKEEIKIDCREINSRLELITAIKDALQYPHFCGDNWNAIEDLIYDIVLPQKLIFFNWDMVKKRLPEDTAILRNILDRNSNGRCTIIYS